MNETNTDQNQKKMNKKQLKCLWLGVIIIVLMGLYPPWYFPSTRDGFKVRLPAGYKLMLTTEKGARVDITRLYVQWVMVGVITGGLIYTFKDKPKDTEKEGTEE